MKSFRTRLTLWNLLILALSLSLFGGLFIFANQRRAAQTIDRGLMDRAMRIARSPNPMRIPPGLGLGPGPRGPGPRGRGPMFQGSPDLGPEPPPGPMPPIQDPFGFLRSARVYDREGNLVGPPNETLVLNPEALQRSLEGEPMFQTREINGERSRTLSVPIFQGGEVVGAVQVARELRDHDQLWQTQVRTLLILLPLALLAAGIGAFFLANRALKPVAQVTKAAEEIGEHDLSRRLDVEGHDELAQLGATFNSMISRLEDSFERQKLALSKMEESYENQRRFTADASHELRTPLTRLKLATSSALAAPEDSRAAREALMTADRAADSMSKLVHQLLLLSKADAGQLVLQRERLDLRVVASDAISLLGAEVSVQFPDEAATVLGDEDHLRRVFLNLLENALRYSNEVSVSIEVAGSEVIATVSDKGPGISPEHLQHVFERFYRADVARSRQDGGSGLGLAICKSIVESHGGRIYLESREGTGTSARVFLPRAEIK